MIALNRRAAIGGALASALLPNPALAEKKYDEGASDTEIKIGHTNPYSGNLSAYGVIGRTHEAFFKMINEQGGIHGRKITFITYDDGFSPPKTVEMVRKLVEEDKVLLLFNTLGTAPNTAIQKYLNQKKVPHLFIASGASKWGDPEHFPWSMGWQPDYVTESIIYTKRILKTVKDPKIGILMQNDDYGKDYLNGFKIGLGVENEKLIVQLSTYEATDPTVDSQMIQLKNSGANVFFNISTPKFAAQAIRKAAELGWKPVQYLNNVSASIGSVMRPAGFENCQGILTATYLKDVTDPQWDNSPDLIAWRAFMAKYYPSGDTTAGEPGYAFAVAHGLVEVMKKCGDDLTRENIMKQAASLQHFVPPMVMPGIEANTSPTNFYPIRSVQMAEFKGQKWAFFGEVLSPDTQ
jgi:branched-chain amino acid transport system substrate-binding protein